MNLLILGGNSLDNQAWVHEVEMTVGSLFDRVVVHEYQHWQNDVAFINFAAELQRLKANSGDLEPYIIFAKSVGVVLAAQGIAEGSLRPHACLFVGTPLGLITKEHYDLPTWLAHAKTTPKVIFAQNSRDPAGSVHELNAYLDNSVLDNCEVIELAGDTHGYHNLAILTELASRFTA